MSGACATSPHPPWSQQSGAQRRHPQRYTLRPQLCLQHFNVSKSVLEGQGYTVGGQALGEHRRGPLGLPGLDQEECALRTGAICRIGGCPDRHLNRPPVTFESDPVPGQCLQPRLPSA